MRNTYAQVLNIDNVSQNNSIKGKNNKYYLKLIKDHLQINE